MNDKRAPRLLFVNYHYLRDPEAYKFPGIHPLSPQAFKDQVRSLGERLHFATPAQVERYVLQGDGLPGPSVFLTFDDGLVDHWRMAREVLDPLGINAGFFICSRPSREGRALAVHKVQWLRAHTEPAAFEADFFARLPADLRFKGDEAWIEMAQRTYVYDLPAVARVKYALNFVLPPDLVDNTTSDMLADRGITERDFCEETYMDKGQLRELCDRGHVLGVHGHTHEPFSRLGAAIYDEVQTNIDFLTEAGGVRPRWVSYPFGREDAIPEPQVLDEMFSRYGFKLGFTLLGTWNDGTQDARRLRRINTNEVDQVVNRALSVG
jgi:peptidoglycan/xylan/chitin deacetylase (PgdA/CDA1 family)